MIRFIIDHKVNDEHDIVSNVNDEDTFIHIWRKASEYLEESDIPTTQKDITRLKRLIKNFKRSSRLIKIEFDERGNTIVDNEIDCQKWACNIAK